MKLFRNLRDIFKKKIYYKTRKKNNLNKLINNKNVKLKKNVKMKEELFNNKIKNRNREIFFVYIR